MTLEANEVSARTNMLATLYSWLTLAGFVVFPGTFSSLTSSTRLGNNKSGKLDQDAVKKSATPTASLHVLLHRNSWIVLSMVEAAEELCLVNHTYILVSDCHY